MPIFSYRATTTEGTIVEGVIEASDEPTAIDRLKNSGIIPLKITTSSEGTKRKVHLQVVKGRYADIHNRAFRTVERRLAY